MSSWADMSEDHNEDYNAGEPSQQPEAPRQRKKLQLKPRSAKATSSPSAGGGSSKANPFGAAKPREEVLASKGIDAKAVDERIQKKAEVLHFTKAQELELEVIRTALSKAEADLRNANENELPEEKHRVLVEEKKRELLELQEKFSKENAERRESNQGGTGGERHKYERPSERRRRLDEEGGGRQGSQRGGDDDNVYSSFGGRRQSDGGKRGGEGSYNREY